MSVRGVRALSHEWRDAGACVFQRTVCSSPFFPAVSEVSAVRASLIAAAQRLCLRGAASASTVTTTTLELAVVIVVIINLFLLLFAFI